MSFRVSYIISAIILFTIWTNNAMTMCSPFIISSIRVMIATAVKLMTFYFN